MIRPGIFCSSWPVKPLSEVVEFLDHIRKPITAKDRSAGPYPYYGANGQQDSVAEYLFNEPLILMAEDGGHFGEPDRTIAYRVDGKCWVNNHAHVLRPRDGVDIGFLCRQLEKYDVTPFISGTTRAKLTKGTLSKLPMTLPPLAEQKRIAAILDKANAIRRKRQQTIALTEDFLRSAFLEMFGDPVTNPKGFSQVPIKDLGKVTTGNTPSRKVPEYYGDDVEWIKSDNINTPHHSLTKSKEMLSCQGVEVGRVVPKNSILVTCIAGSPDCIGNAALADREVAFNQQINAITPVDKVDPYFLYVQLLVGKKHVQKASTNSMKGMISKGKFEEILFINPPFSLQKKFGQLFLKYHAQVSKSNDSDGAGDDLFNSLVQRAFRGEL